MTLSLSLLTLVLPSQASKRAKIDREIAAHAGALGVNRLAGNPTDPGGLVLLQLAGTLRPTDDAYLLTVARLEKGLPIEPGKTKVTEKKLVSVMGSRAEKLRKKAEEDSDTDAGQLALLYYRVVEHFLPENNTVLLGIMKLKVAGITGELQDLLQSKVTVSAPANPAASATADPGRADALFKRAKALEAKGDSKEAQALWQRFLAVEPNGERKTTVQHGWVSITTETFPLRTECFLWSPDGKHMLYHAHNEWHTIDLATQENTKVEGMADAKGVYAWSLDGRYLATDVDHRWTYMYELTPGGHAKRTTTDPIAAASPLALSPDGKSILVLGRQGDRRVAQHRRAIIELATGEVELVPSTPGRNAATAIAWTPDGEGMACLSFPGSTGKEGQGDCAIFSMRADFKEPPVQLTPGGESLYRLAISPDGSGVAYGAGTEEGYEGRVVPLDGNGQPVVLGPGGFPQWSADGRSLALLTKADGFTQIAVHRLGGIDPRPAEFAVKQVGRTLNLAVRNRTRDAETFAVTCELFDDHSLRIAQESYKDIDLRAGKVATFKVTLAAARKHGKYTAKLTAIPRKGPRAIELVDLLIH